MKVSPPPNTNKKIIEELIVSKEIKPNEYKTSLEELLVVISHKIRQPIAHILGLSNLLDHPNNSPSRIKKILVSMKEAASNLDKRTRDLSALIFEKLMKL